MDLIKKISRIFLLILKVAVLHAFNYCPEYSPKCECLSSFSLKCENFSNLDELSFSSISQLTLSNILIRPTQSIRFDYSPLFNLFNNLTLRSSSSVISLSNFQGINIFKNPFSNLRTDQTIQLILEFNETNLEFYANQKLIDETDCSSPSLNMPLASIFLPFDTIIFYETVKYSTNLCPKVFANAFLSEIYFYNFNNLNKFAFYTTDLSQNFNQLKVERLFFVESQIISLDSSILNRNLFRSILSLGFYNSYLVRIEKSLLGNFKYLNRVIFDLNNFNDLVYDLSWINELNPEFSNVNPTSADFYQSFQIEIMLGDRQMQYEFTEQNFCVFKDFPHQKLVYPALFTKENLTCSCTVMWLIQYYKLFKFKERLETKSIANCINDDLLFEQTILNCNFSQRIDACDLNGSRVSKDGLTDWELALAISLPLLFVLIVAAVGFIVIFVEYKRMN